MPVPVELADASNYKLEIINRCLQAIGETPLVDGTVASDLELGTDAQIASSIVDDTWVEVLNKGWWFNTDYNYELSPDDDGFIAFPDTVLRIDSGRYQSLTKREGMLYDTSENTFIFTDKKYVNLIWLVSYSDLPPSVYEYIACKAARKFQQKIIGNSEHTNMLKMEEQEALVDLQREDAQYQDFNLIEPNVSQRWTNPYRGF